MKVLCTGGCGYVGCVLVPKLLAEGHHVRVVDIQWFGNALKPHQNLEVVKSDIREQNFQMADMEAIIHLAGVANDPTGDLDPKLTWEVNALATMQLIDRAARYGIGHFIYASSGSVYGVSHEPQVTEGLPLVPLSEYNKTKMVAERVVLSYSDRMAVQVVRPATVCGYSPRMRLDVVVNAITMQALTNGVITIQGGKQYRPNIHIEDMTDLYLWLLDKPYPAGVFNAGFENMTVADIARLVGERLRVGVNVNPSNDPRSYRVNSDKLLATGFRPRKTVADAVEEIIAKVRAGELSDEPNCYNLKAMQYRRAA